MRALQLIARHAALLIAMATASMPARADRDVTSPAGLTPDQARALLTLVIRHDGLDPTRHGMDIELLTNQTGDSPHPGYFDFSLTFETPQALATEVLGVWSVSVATGDVWEINRCRHYSFAALRGAQREIRRRTHRSLADEAENRRGLGCSD